MKLMEVIHYFKVKVFHQFVMFVHKMFLNGIVHNHEIVISIENLLIVLHHYHVHNKFLVIQVQLEVIIYRILIIQQLILNPIQLFVLNNQNFQIIQCKFNLLKLFFFKIFSFSKPNISSYTGKTHWTKIDPVSHHDQSGYAYTTTAAFHK
jgi:hypothetical protein